MVLWTHRDPDAFPKLRVENIKCWTEIVEDLAQAKHETTEVTFELSRNDGSGTDKQ